MPLVDYPSSDDESATSQTTGFRRTEQGELRQQSPQPADADDSSDDGLDDVYYGDTTPLAPPPTHQADNALIVYSDEDEGFEACQDWALSHGYALVKCGVERRKIGGTSNANTAANHETLRLLQRQRNDQIRPSRPH